MSYVAFPFLADSSYVKPDKSNKLNYPTLDEKYHLDFAKWALFNANEGKHSEWLRNTYRNKRYYMGKQWEKEEDIQSFLMDESGNTKHRIKIVINQIRPMVEQFRGNAIRLAIGAEAKSVSKHAQVRRERALKRVLLINDIAGEFESLGETLKNQDPSIKDSQEDAELIFENTYVDKYVEVINRLITFSAEFNEMTQMQVKIAENMAFSGVGTIEEFKHGEHLRKEVVQPEEFFWDRNARRSDLQDSAYMGRVHMMTAPDIFERWQGLEEKDREMINSYLSTASNVNNTYGPQNHTNQGNSIPVYKVFFIDDTTKVAGYVEDEFKQPYLTYLNEEDKFQKGKVYTESDLIEPPDTVENKRLFKGNKKRTVSVATLRYCIFIPGEVINYRKTGERTNGRYSDVVMEYGEYDYQETNWMDLSMAKYPLKSYTWSYIDGQALSPIDDIIDPQRFMNRIMSAIEGQVNQSGGSNMVYDLDMIDDQQNEADLHRNAKTGAPIGIRTRGKGVPNTIGFYDNTIKPGTYQMFSLIPTLKDMMQSVTGVNEGLRGESTGSDQLVGVTQLLIQRGSLMQEPFYDAVARVFLQSHQSTATFGKDIYIDNQRELIEIAGDESVKIFKLAEGLRHEDFRVFINRSPNPEQMQEQANNVLTILLQYQMIDKKFFADHWGRSTISVIQRELRRQVNKELIAAKMAEQEQAAAAQAANAQAQQEMAAATDQARNEELNQMEFEMAKEERNKQHDLEKTALQGAIKGAQGGL